ncbi:hypothetical protein H4R33_005792 [Dimargaris cristalligena]|uniref:Uncharacterized protein n=1 Tax=Dimargaris cristalligena TaxID=215637 RepID=A0A4P9ZS26_9FUNG|nr:hypothetical protein H4R33_005792 [Dimargaris cristalligena]RKP36263.1 hypothetical protein BJ085DRAFT_28807 [Dimargaris cristalligena]|eukprot:RKP36263.1 hypothetical protein BJ085DRAFT_28807 [Dimargaris cristalligena]
MRFAILTLATLATVSSVAAHLFGSHTLRTPLSQHLVRRVPQKGNTSGGQGQAAPKNDKQGKSEIKGVTSSEKTDRSFVPPKRQNASGKLKTMSKQSHAWN